MQFSTSKKGLYSRQYEIDFDFNSIQWSISLNEVDCVRNLSQADLIHLIYITIQLWDHCTVFGLQPKWITNAVESLLNWLLLMRIIMHTLSVPKIVQIATISVLKSDFGQIFHFRCFSRKSKLVLGFSKQINESGLVWNLMIFPKKWSRRFLI